jgi:hypothetical protein
LCCFVTAFHHSDKIPNTNSLKGKGLFWLTVSEVSVPVALGVWQHSIAWRECVVRSPIHLIMVRKKEVR